jgi:acetate kinase
MTEAVLVLNAGSGTVKFSMYAVPALAAGDGRAALRGRIDGIGREGVIEVVDADGTFRPVARLPAPASHADAIAAILCRTAAACPDLDIAVAGHRFVHGGPRHFAPVRVDDDVLAALEAAVPLAPLHQPHSLAGVRAVAAQAPGLPQVACFDTGFHRTMPRVARIFGLPRYLTDAGVVRYGFHGLSYESVAAVLPAVAGAAAAGRVIVAHLGHGASLCAMHGGRSVATTMSFTPLDGVPMSTRCGDLDPGVVLYLQQQLGWTVERVHRLLYHESGLLGVSGISADMRDLLASGSEDAAVAVELFVYRTAREIGSLAAALGGVDLLVFTGGIGEHAATIREGVLRQCGWLGVRVDRDANARHGPRIDTRDGAVSAWVVHTNEELVIARHARDVLSAAPAAVS